MKKLFIVTLIAALAVLPLVAKGQPDDAQKKKITSVDQLPRRTYKIEGTLMELIKNQKKFDAFSKQVIDDIKSDLANYDIQDKTTIKSYYNALLSYNVINRNFGPIPAMLEKLRKMESKPGARLTIGMTLLPFIDTYNKFKDSKHPKFAETYAQLLKQNIRKLPWDTVQENIIGNKSQVDMITEALLTGLIKTQMEPAVAKAGFISSDMASQLIAIRLMMNDFLPLREATGKVYSDIIAANRKEKKDIWKAREVDLTHSKNLTPVVVAVWDTGVDTGIFAKQLFTNNNETKDGKDNDNNGFIDDINGIAFDLDAQKNTQLLYGADSGTTGELDEKMALFKGFTDLQNAIDSPECTSLKKKFASMKPTQVKTFMEDLMKLIYYMHGTHVSGIIVDGNPHVRILTVRQTWDYNNPPKPFTTQLSQNYARLFKDTVQYLKANNVRVVNMSWDQSIKEIEGGLASNGIGKNAEERGKMARELFTIMKDAFYEAIKSAPEILFCNSAGNSDDDPGFMETMPTSFDLPNVMVVGAVDQAGERTTFTSSGKVVDVYANGYNVVSYVPGGKTLPASGTSMSSPQVANLAAKLLALNSKLTTKQVVELIKKGADKSKDGKFLLINPKRSVELIKEIR